MKQEAAASQQLAIEPCHEMRVTRQGGSWQRQLLPAAATISRQQLMVAVAAAAACCYHELHALILHGMDCRHKNVKYRVWSRSVDIPDPLVRILYRELRCVDN